MGEAASIIDPIAQMNIELWGCDRKATPLTGVDISGESIRFRWVGHVRWMAAGATGRFMATASGRAAGGQHTSRYR